MKLPITTRTYHLMKSTYQKIRFTSRNGSTAGLVFDSLKIERSSVSELSRFFPYSEASKMARIQVSPKFNTWEEAFEYQFEDVY